MSAESEVWFVTILQISSEHEIVYFLRRTRQTNLSFSLNGTLWHWKPSLSTPFCLPFTTRELPFTSSSLNHFSLTATSATVVTPVPCPSILWTDWTEWRGSDKPLRQQEISQTWLKPMSKWEQSKMCEKVVRALQTVFQPIQSCFEIWRQDLHRKHFQVQVALYNPSSLQVSEIHSLPPERERCNHCN